MNFLRRKPTFLEWCLLFSAAFILRAATFYWYVQKEERYCQPDSYDYHVAALCLAHGYGMFRPDTQKPIFWRTPGYPWFLHHFYKKHTINKTSFTAAEKAHKEALWIQIILSSFLPLLFFVLAFILTHSYPIAWLSSFVAILHIGFILASSYLLTDALAALFFLLFLIFYCYSFPFSIKKKSSFIITVIFSALFLALYTWFRPMGQFVAFIAGLMLLFSSFGWKSKVQKAVLFLAVFAISIFPWFYRNYQLTGTWFFCPLFGLYFNVFNAPKILSRIEHIPLKEAHQKLTQQAGRLTALRMQEAKKSNSPYYVCGEIVCLETAWPLIKTHPFYFLYDWCMEAAKTTFDLYASQLVSFAKNCFKWDPLVEYLPEKLADCLYKAPLSWFMRLLAWIEAIFYLLLWIGIFSGVVTFLMKPFLSKRFHFYTKLWLMSGFFIGAVVFQTGGFGYARLRLPIEPLMIILGITFWWWFFNERKK